MENWRVVSSCGDPEMVTPRSNYDPKGQGTKKWGEVIGTEMWTGGPAMLQLRSLRGRARGSVA